MSQYETIIREELATYSRPEVSPRWVEAWIRLELHVLDWLDRARFSLEVGIALQCIDASTPEKNETLAASLMGPIRTK